MINETYNVISDRQASENCSSSLKSEDDVVAATQINLPIYVMHARGDWLYKALPGMERKQIGLRVGTGSVQSIVKRYR